MNHNHHTGEQEWQREFDEKFGYFWDVHVQADNLDDKSLADIMERIFRQTPERIKDFIRTLLSHQKTKFLEAVPEEQEAIYSSTPNFEKVNSHIEGWNAAIKQIHTNLKEVTKDKEE